MVTVRADRRAPAGSGPVHEDAAGETTREPVTGPVHRALAILELLGSDEVRGPLGVVEIARLLGWEKSQISRSLRLLADAGFVDREPRTRRYRVGTRLFAIAAKAVDRRLREEADVVTQRLSALLDERVEVAVRSGGRAVTIASAAPENVLLAVGWVGRTHPLSSTAAGRCLLFDVDDELIAKLAAPGNGGPKAAGSIDEVLRRVRADAVRGFAVCVEESDHGLLAIGAPIRDLHGRAAAGLQVVGPLSRMGGSMDASVDQVLAAATEVSVALGAPAGRPAARQPVSGRGGTP